jgi:hypothetical protein
MAEQNIDDILEKLKQKIGELENHPLEGAEKFELAGIPIGPALTGAMMAVMASEMIDAFLPKRWWERAIIWLCKPIPLRWRMWVIYRLPRRSRRLAPVIRLMAAGILGRHGHHLLGEAGSKAAALILAYDGLRDLYAPGELKKYMDKKGRPK